MNHNLRGLLFWLFAAYVLCLMPGPIFWVDWLQPPVEEPQSEVSKPTTVKRDRPKQVSVDSDPSILLTKSISVDGAVDSFESWREQHGSKTELSVHFTLMFGISFCLVRLLNRSPTSVLPSLLFGHRRTSRRLSSVAISLIAILLISLSIEGLQELLPEFFHRGYALSDVWASLAGGLLGSLLGVVRSWKFGMNVDD